MTTLTLTSCNNKANKKPWLAILELGDDGQIKYDFQRPDKMTAISGTRNEYEWDLKEGVLYCKGDTHNYSKYYVNSFIIENGEERILTNREAKEHLKNKAL